MATVAETSAREAQCTDGRSPSICECSDERGSVGTHRRSENNEAVGVETAPGGMRVGKQEPYALVKDFDDWDFTFNGYAGKLDPAYPALLKTARQTTTVVMATPPH